MHIRFFKWIVSFAVIYFICSHANAQNSIADSLQKQFVQYQSLALQEKVFVHIDRTFYLAGETVWFKIYDVDSRTNKPLNISSIAYIEIIDKDQKAVLQTKVEIKEGSGDGSIILPFSISSGNYIFRCYTNWMKNFDPSFYFSQQVTIINTLKVTAANEPGQKNTLSIQFFPEGGNLVEGLSSKIAFKAVNKNGEGIDCSGVIINQKKDTITSFKTSRFGMGNFNLTPKKGESYFAIIKTGDTILTQPLQSANTTGYTMRTDEINDNKIKISVKANVQNLATPIVYLLVHTRQVVKSLAMNYLNNSEANFIIDKKNLGEGISHITIFDSDKHPICERLIFMRPEKKLNIIATTDQKEYDDRKKVTIDFTSSDQSGKPLQANISMSVFLTDSFQSTPTQNISNYFLLTSDLKGKVESPQYYFENSSPEANEAADNLMLTQGWSRFKWNDVFQNKKPSFEFPPEIEGPVINGKIIDRRNTSPAKEMIGYLTIPGKNFEFNPSLSSDNGDVKFYLKKIYGHSEMIAQTNSRTDSNYRIDITNSFSDKFSFQPLTDFSLSAKWENQLLNKSINMQVENSYLISKKNVHASLPDMDTTMFYGKPEDQYYLDDYTRFITMEEVMREYIYDVRIRRESNKYIFRVRNNFFNIFFETDPMILIDGVPVFDADKIMAVDPLKIKRIDVVTYKYYKGPSVTDGLVSYKTYDGDLAGYQLDPNALVVDYEGLQSQKEFYSPVYEKEDQLKSPIPDFRNLLMWAPNIKTDANGKSHLSFYTSDLTGKFALVVQGLSNDGLLGSSIITFDVIDKK